MYWLITYQWTRDNINWNHSHYIWEGGVADWMLMANEQPERWVLLNAVEISKYEYTRMKGIIE